MKIKNINKQSIMCEKNNNDGFYGEKGLPPKVYAGTTQSETALIDLQKETKELKEAVLSKLDSLENSIEELSKELDIVSQYVSSKQ